ncbi:uncharacterized protein BXZ73DRAFT_99885 [Epithele typhae]|uniref:uncharacterized protein n=1 Tax=Epithele typhae TaxID=378194 RepID=UPI002007EDF2|nr:uncharacterized protein BXZ73DRAFT_99885 [Epithele typhae]KAH9938824.1 hypothetical protein BXZ73DRAFT_99885 [Epithele typhae]
MLSLGRSCRALKDICNPLIYANITIEWGGELDETHWNVPPQLRPLVKHLALQLRCRRGRQWMADDSDEEIFEWHCEPLPPPCFGEILASMHQLSQITLDIDPPAGHCHPWALAQLLVSTPTLRGLSVRGLEIAPKDSCALECAVPALTSLTYLVGETGRPVRDSARNLQILSSLLEATHNSVESLHLSAPLVPWSRVHELEWPRLRALTVSGMVRLEVESYASILPQFAPRLDRLSLELSLASMSTTPLGGGTTAFPWPALRHLALPLPLPEDDPAYARLPSTLEMLSLLCYPRHCATTADTGLPRRRDFPLPASTGAMAAILRRCAASPGLRLTQLSVEYVADANDDNDAVLALVSDAFPRLEELSLFRYRLDGAYEAPEATAAAVCAALAPLTRLRVVRTPLDSSFWPEGDGDGFGRETMQRVALAAARELTGAPLEEIWLWTPSAGSVCEQGEWKVFQVLPGLGGGPRERESVDVHRRRWAVKVPQFLFG